MDIYPAIDLRGGSVVRLVQGDFDRETSYGKDPLGVAEGYLEAGASWIHVVDLDAARSGVPAHLDVISDIATRVGVAVQAGGGVRSREAAVRLLDTGAERIVIGTAAVEHPELVAELCDEYPGRVAVGLDARGRDVATRGWETGTGADLLLLAEQFSQLEVGALVVTEIGRDGTLSGPDLEQLASVLEVSDRPVIASGGVGSLEHLAALRELQANGRGLAGVIVGKALYSGRFSLAEALAIANPS